MSQYGASGPPRAATVWLLPALVGAVTFSAFVGYAFLTPAVYRTSALIEVWSANEQAPSRLEPLEASRRLHEAVLDSAVLERLAEDRAPGASAESKSQLARVIESALQIDTVDARTFTVSFRDSDRARAESSCNWLAERVIEHAPRVLAPDGSAEERALEAERRRRANALQVFLAAHPGLSGNPVVAPASSANAEPSNAALQAELKQLLADLAKAREASSSAATDKPALKARLVTPAHASFWPLEPDRPRLLLMGLLAALGAGALAAFLGKRRGGDSSESTPPPGVSSNPPPAATSSYPPYAGSSYPPALGASSNPPARASYPSATPTTSSYPPPPPIPPADAQRVSSYPPGPPRNSSNQASFGEPIVPARVVSPPPPAPEASVPSARESVRERASSNNESDRITPVSAYPPALAGTHGERPLRPALEVNAGVPAADKRSSAPAASVVPRGQSARTTHVLGSPIPPIIAPGSRRLPSVGSGEQTAAAPVSTTGYSYVSSAPPNAGPSSHPRGVAPQVPERSAFEQALANGPSTRRFVSSPPPGKDPSVVSVQRAPAGWRADLSLLPESRRHLCDEIYPFAVDSCCVLGVLGGPDTADAKSRLAAELALALAESGHTRVLLLEGDLERCEVRRLLRAEMPIGKGFSEQMKARIATSSTRPWVVLECSSSLHVLSESLETTPDLIYSRAFEDCLRELRNYYDFIVIDGPLISNANACRAVHDVVDRVVFSHGRFGPSELADAQALLPNKRISVVPAFG